MGRWILILLCAAMANCATGITPVEPIVTPWNKCDVAHLQFYPDKSKIPADMKWIDRESAFALERASQDCMYKLADAIEENAKRARHNRTAYEKKEPTLSEKVDAGWKGALVQDVLIVVLYLLLMLIGPVGTPIAMLTGYL